MLEKDIRSIIDLYKTKRSSKKEGLKSIYSQKTEHDLDLSASSTNKQYILQKCRCFQQRHKKRNAIIRKCPEWPSNWTPIKNFD